MPLTWFRDGVRALLQQKIRKSSVMVWRGFSASSQTELAFLRGKQISKDYIKTIFSILTPFAKTHHENDFDFHQDAPQRV